MKLMNEYERRNCIWLYEILRGLGHEDTDWLSQRIEIMQQGYELLYDEDLPDKNVLSREQCRFVIDVLAMFEKLNLSFDRLQDRTGVDEQKLRFRGFDGNNEGKHMSFAEFFCGRMGRFADLRIRNVMAVCCKNTMCCNVTVVFINHKFCLLSAIPPSYRCHNSSANTPWIITKTCSLGSITF